MNFKLLGILEIICGSEHIWISYENQSFIWYEFPFDNIFFIIPSLCDILKLDGLKNVSKCFSFSCDFYWIEVSTSIDNGLFGY